MKLSVVVRVSVATLFLMLSAMALFGQSERGTITGTVHDASGAVIPGAKVSVTATATNSKQDYLSNDSGDYTASSLAVGQYDIRIEKAGFRPAELKGVTVNAATSVRADASLEVGTSTTAVERTASAGQLHTEDAKT